MLFSFALSFFLKINMASTSLWDELAFISRYHPNCHCQIALPKKNKPFIPILGRGLLAVPPNLPMANFERCIGRTRQIRHLPLRSGTDVLRCCLASTASFLKRPAHCFSIIALRNVICR